MRHAPSTTPPGPWDSTCSGTTISTCRSPTTAARCSPASTSSTRSTCSRRSRARCASTAARSTRVTGSSAPAKTGRPTVRLDDGTELAADDIVLATGTPILDRGLYFAKLEPLRSYALAFDFATTPMPMSLSAGQPSRSIRDVPRGDGTTKLMIGGNGHTVGRTDSEARHVDELREWTAKYFPGAVETHVWSAQDYQSHDGIPYVGKLPRGGGHIHVATGFDKWGMTNAVAAARNLTSSLLGEPVSWSKPMSRRITRPQGAAKIAELNLGVGVELAKGIVQAELQTAPESPAEGSGEVGRDGVLPTGVSTVDGRTCAVRAVCTHLGGILSWNDQEKSWDCPLHGSRFTPEGEVLEGPATRALHRPSARAGRGPEAPCACRRTRAGRRTCRSGTRR